MHVHGVHATSTPTPPPAVSVSPGLAWAGLGVGGVAGQCWKVSLLASSPRPISIQGRPGAGRGGSGRGGADAVPCQCAPRTLFKSSRAGCALALTTGLHAATGCHRLPQARRARAGHVTCSRDYGAASARPPRGEGRGEGRGRVRSFRPPHLVPNHPGTHSAVLPLPRRITADSSARTDPFFGTTYWAGREGKRG